MIQAEERQQLCEALSKLINGEMINDDFSSLYFEGWKRSTDRGVAAIAEFGYSLYSDIDIYRLEGRHAIKPESRKIADRCLQFLQTQGEYLWPPFPGFDWKQWLLSGWYPGCLCFAIALILVSLFMLSVENPIGLFLMLFIPGSLLLAMSIFLWRWWSKYQSPKWKRFWATGDKDAWPFLRVADWEQKRTSSPDTPPAPLLPPT